MIAKNVGEGVEPRKGGGRKTVGLRAEALMLEFRRKNPVRLRADVVFCKGDAEHLSPFIWLRRNFFLGGWDGGARFCSLAFARFCH